MKTVRVRAACGLSTRYCTAVRAYTTAASAVSYLIYAQIAQTTPSFALPCMTAAEPDLAGGRPGAQPNYGSISLTGASLGAHKTRGSRR